MFLERATGGVSELACEGQEPRNGAISCKVPEGTRGSVLQGNVTQGRPHLSHCTGTRQASPHSLSHGLRVNPRGLPYSVRHVFGPSSRAPKTPECPQPPLVLEPFSAHLPRGEIKQSDTQSSLSQVPLPASQCPRSQTHQVDPVSTSTPLQPWVFPTQNIARAITMGLHFSP